MPAITTKLTGRKGSKSGVLEFEFVGIDKVTRALSPAGLPDEIVGIVGFNTPYALAQHERLDFHHPKGGKAKYLEDPLKENVRRYGQHINKRLKTAVAGKAWRGGLAAAIVDGCTQAMTEIVEDLLSRAQREAPIDEGTLRATGSAAVLVDGRRISGSVTPQTKGEQGGPTPTD
jgi:hypothetical protein